MTNKQPSNSLKKSLFYFIALLIPICFFVGAEIWLRASQQFEPVPLFIDVPNMEGYLQPNPDVMQRFFPKPEMTPKVSPDTQFFKKEKASDSFRIVVQGGSTAAGFPYGRWGSLAGMLQQRFKRIYPEKDIEIINTAMASVNSYTLLDFNDEIQALEPDLVMIYAGHNEFLGVMGVGSAFASKGGRGATLLHLKAKNLRFYKWVENVYYTYFADIPTDAGSADQRTLMSKIAKEKEIKKDSELYHAGVAQFEGNLSLVLQAYQEADIPVMVGNLVSNEAHQVPFSGVNEFNEAQLNSWLTKATQEKTDLLNQLREDASSSVLAKPQDPALREFLAGKLALNLGNSEAAKTHFQSARDLDLLRFRAPSEFNQIITSLTRQFGAILVDVDRHIRSDTKNGIIGEQHMLEHLHPNERGYFMLADAYVEAFKAQRYITDVVNYPDDIKQAWSERPISKADALYAQFKIANLTSDYPFVRTGEGTKPQPPQNDTLEARAVRDRINGEGWLDLNLRLVPQYHKQKDFAQDAMLSGLLADALPSNRSWGYIAGYKYKQINNLPLALYYLHREYKAKPHNYAARLSLAQTYYFMSRKSESLKHLYFVKQHKPDHPNIDQIIAKVKGD